MKENKEHHIYFEYFLDDRAGGPPGYLANLLLGLNRVNYHTREIDIVFNTFKGKFPRIDKKLNIIGYIKKLLKIFIGRDIYAKYVSRFHRKSYHDLMLFFKKDDLILPNEILIKEIDLSKTKTIHVHSAIDVVKIKNYLINNFYDDIKIILTAHTPESLSIEQYNLVLDDGQNIERAEEIRRNYLKLEQEGFQKADIIIYPSEESMEAHFNSIEEFDKIIYKKDIRFLPTGIRPLRSLYTKEEIKRKYGVSGKKVIVYLGRHNAIKGYDFLLELGKKLLEERGDIVFLIGGTQSKQFLPLANPNWKELGWINPSEVLPAADVFLLPNKQTYYDLVLLEVMSLGIPIIASNTGGNKSIKKLVNDIVLCELSIDLFIQKINDILSLSSEEWSEKSNNIKECYDRFFTAEKMASGYIEIINKIYDDYNL